MEGRGDRGEKPCSALGNDRTSMQENRAFGSQRDPSLNTSPHLFRAFTGHFLSASLRELRVQSSSRPFLLRLSSVLSVPSVVKKQPPPLRPCVFALKPKFQHSTKNFSVLSVSLW